MPNNFYMKWLIENGYAARYQIFISLNFDNMLLKENIKIRIFQDGKFYMGVRSIAELLQYFKDTYEDNLQICTLCKQELFYVMFL